MRCLKRPFIAFFSALVLSAGIAAAQPEESALGSYVSPYAGESAVDARPLPYYRLYVSGAQEYTLHAGEWALHQSPHPPLLPLSPGDALVYVWGEEPDAVTRVDVWTHLGIDGLSKPRSEYKIFPVYSDFDTGVRNIVIARDALGEPISKAQVTLHVELEANSGEFLRLTGFSSGKDGRIPSVAFFPRGAKVYTELQHPDYGTALLESQARWPRERFPLVHNGIAEASHAITGVVLTHDGKPAGGVAVGIHPEYGRIQEGQIHLGSNVGLEGSDPFVVTDVNGEFRIHLPIATDLRGGDAPRPVHSGFRMSVSSMGYDPSMIPFQQVVGGAGPVVLRFPARETQAPQ